MSFIRILLHGLHVSIPLGEEKSPTTTADESSAPPLTTPQKVRGFICESKSILAKFQDHDPSTLGGAEQNLGAAAASLGTETGQGDRLPKFHTYPALNPTRIAPFGSTFKSEF